MPVAGADTATQLTERAFKALREWREYQTHIDALYDLTVECVDLSADPAISQALADFEQNNAARLVTQLQAGPIFTQNLTAIDGGDHGGE